jgi:hypothetical protein
VLTLAFQQPVIHYVHNADYRDTMTAVGEMIFDRTQQYSALNSLASYLTFGAFKKLWRRLDLYAFATKKLPTHGQRNAHAHRGSLHRHQRKSVDDDMPIDTDWSTYEYAIERKILDAPLLQISYYADVVGEVPDIPNESGHLKPDFDVGNRDTDPEWGVDLIITGGSITYGPWADRQR